MSDESPSFVRGMFAGAIRDDLLFPFPAPLDERDPDETRTVRRLLAALDRMRNGLIDSARFDEEETLPEEVITALAESGWLGISIPREYGGLGLSPAAYAHVSGELASTDASLGVLIGVHCGLGSKAIVLFGTPEQKARYLPMLARGETLAAYALTEPETGSDAQHIVTQARQNADGSWTLNGRKHWIGNGHRAGVIATFAQTPVERNGEMVTRPTAFILRPDMPGFSVAGTVRKLGIRGSTQAELVYTDLQVPADHVLGTVGKGFGVAVQVLNGGRMTLAAGCTAGTRKLVGQMVEFAEQRVQFGRPIADFEITQRKLARTASDVYAADAMLGVLTHLAASEGELALEAACCKVFASEMIWRAADEMVQIAGGRGFVKPWPYERLLRDSRINRIFEGTNEILRLFISLNGIEGPAEDLKEIGVALRQPLKNLGLLSTFAASQLASRLGAATPTLDVPLHDRLKDHASHFEKHVADLRNAAEATIRAHRRQIIERQQELERLADMAIELFATACVLSRTQRLLAERGEAGCAHELDLCDLFVIEAGRRFRASRIALQSRQDETRRAVAQGVRGAGGYAVESALLRSS